ncbi:hypothetical protein BDW59DRAFT_150866 [Aspergillus cavernicola]|uniref:Uncharacterized protein n=1 Tax=Aspergillus cavernicola TaxID=176166 RepID=A0ABR4HXT4_9EURO
MYQRMLKYCTMDLRSEVLQYPHRQFFGYLKQPLPDCHSPAPLQTTSHPRCYRQTIRHMARARGPMSNEQYGP